MYKVKKNILIILGLLVILIFGIYVLVPTPDFSSFNYSKVIYDRDGEILRVFLSKDRQWCFAPESNLDIPRKLEKCVITYEDKNFYHHFGVDPIAVIRAIAENIEAKKVISGASTLTMQVCRLANPKSRTLINKIIETFQAVKLEFVYSKEEILKKYFTHAPYGSNIIGLKAACLKYFNKEPQELTWNEAASLAILPNNPSLVAENNIKKIAKKKNKLLKQLYANRIIDEEIYKLSKLEQIDLRFESFPFVAPHFTRKAARLKNEHYVKTTLDKQIQKKVKNIADSKYEELNKMGIKNYSVIVVNTESGEIISYLGSQNFKDMDNHGQVDGNLAPRSPGSTLKPFLYALAIETGLIIPQTKLFDIPRYYGAFTPRNANGKYSGLVNAKDALVRSLNVPTVNLLQKVSIEDFYLFLESAGITTLFRRPSGYGLGLVLGNCEVKPIELAGLYAGLGNYGKFKKVSYILDSKKKTQKILNKGACYLTLNMLKEVKRPGTDRFWNLFENESSLAWKTGTSYGNKDAWAVGVNQEWTIVVWTGNFDSETNPALKGYTAAAPLLFDIFNYLAKKKKAKWFDPPLDCLRKVEICSETGYIAKEICPRKEEAFIPKNDKLLAVCPFHKKIYVDEKEKHQVCSRCWDSESYKSKIRLVYPPTVQKILKNSHKSYQNTLSHNPSCEFQGSKDPLKIIYPSQNAKIYLPKDYGAQQQKLIIKVAHEIRNSRIFWYVNHKYLGFTKDNHDRAVYLKKGKYKLMLIDENGFTESINFELF